MTAKFRTWRGARHVAVMVGALASVATGPAQARHYIRHGAGGSNPPYAAIVVDANSGHVLHAVNPDEARHPASLTKIMTLFLLFERLEAGKMRLDSPIAMSEHAAAQAPTKLGLRPGETIAVEDAIRAVVTKSANDVAVAIAEAIAGDEREFAELMTQKARALGMSRTVYRNASGLPNDDQITSARDQATLGRAVQERFPKYYRFFATPSFTYRGMAMRNHNHLLGQVEGLDGIKTGYTEASGFNLVTSVRRSNRHLVSVVLGGSSAGARDARMRELIEQYIQTASTQRSAPVITEVARENEPEARAAAGRPNRGESHATYSVASFDQSKAVTRSVPAAPPTTDGAAAEPGAALPGGPAAGSAPAAASAPIRPIQVKTLKVNSTAAPAAPEAPVPADAPANREVTAADLGERAPAAPDPIPALLAQSPDPASRTPKGAKRGAAPAAVASLAANSPNTSGSPTPAGSAAPANSPNALNSASASISAMAPNAATPQSPAATGPEPAPHSAGHAGWIIQIGAFDAESEARQKLSAAQAKARALGRADAFTEVIVKGDKRLYRARFAGLQKKEEAEEACRQLKRNDIACMTIKN